MDSWAGNELAQLVLALAAERAIERVLGIATASRAHFGTLLDASRRSCYLQADHGDVAVATLFGLNEVPRSSDLASQRGLHKPELGMFDGREAPQYYPEVIRADRARTQ